MRCTARVRKASGPTAFFGRHSRKRTHSQRCRRQIPRGVLVNVLPRPSPSVHDEYLRNLDCSSRTLFVRLRVTLVTCSRGIRGMFGDMYFMGGSIICYWPMSGSEAIPQITEHPQLRPRHSIPPTTQQSLFPAVEIFQNELLAMKATGKVFPANEITPLYPDEFRADGK